MPSYPFLSDAWLDEARAIRAEYEGKTPPVAHSVRMNLVVTAVPFSDDDILAHMDTSSGELVLDVGHLETLAPPREPWVAELVIDDGQGLVFEGGVDVLGPQRPALVQVLVRVDDDRHSPASSCPVWPMTDDRVRASGVGDRDPRRG